MLAHDLFHFMTLTADHIRSALAPVCAVMPDSS